MTAVGNFGKTRVEASRELLKTGAPVQTVVAVLTVERWFQRTVVAV